MNAVNGSILFTRILESDGTERISAKWQGGDVIGITYELFNDMVDDGYITFEGEYALLAGIKLKRLTILDNADTVIFERVREAAQ